MAGTEGEELLEEFFDEQNIKFQREIKIKKLKDDSLPYRKADFYLPQYKTYVEFFGLWNIDSSKQKYKEKMNIYEKNKIPCVYIFPDNLGILGFIFRRRLKKVLRENNMKWQLFKLNWTLFEEKILMNLLNFVLIILIIYVDNYTWKILLIILLIISIGKTFKETFLR